MLRTGESMDLKTYKRLIDEYAWYSRGDIFEIARAARELNRDYMADIVEAKLQLIESKSTVI